MEPPHVHFAENGASGIAFGNVRPPVNLTSGRSTLGIVQNVQEAETGVAKHLQSGINAPNLTDQSQKGSFPAMRNLPPAWANAFGLRTRLGIATRPATVMRQAPSSGAPRPLTSAIPAPVRRAVSRVRLLAGRLTR